MGIIIAVLVAAYMFYKLYESNKKYDEALEEQRKKLQSQLEMIRERKNSHAKYRDSVIKNTKDVILPSTPRETKSKLEIVRSQNIPNTSNNHDLLNMHYVESSPDSDLESNSKRSHYSHQSSNSSHNSDTSYSGSSSSSDSSSSCDSSSSSSSSSSSCD